MQIFIGWAFLPTSKPIEPALNEVNGFAKNEMVYQRLTVLLVGSLPTLQWIALFQLENEFCRNLYKFQAT